MTGARDSAWIIGASSGIGRTLARRLAQNGWHVVASARSAGALDGLAAEHPGKIRPLPLDVTDAPALRAAVDDAETLLGAPPALIVHAAGMFRPVAVDDFDRDAFADMNAVNYMGAVNLLAAALPGCLARGTGHIALVASVAGYRGLPRAGAYSASKAAVINLCEALAPELEPRGVRLRVVNPGFVDTPMTAQNDFPMPFLISAEDAAERLMKALTESSRFEITFPKRFTWIVKAMRLLPYAAYLPLMRRVIRRRNVPPG